MIIPVWVPELAAAFWRAAGGEEPFPRSLRRPLLHCPFDLTVKELPGLSAQGMGRYLASLGMSWRWNGRDRPLRACLVAGIGAGLICLNADDPEGERTFSLAHELAHFLRHYWEPRRTAVQRLGTWAAEVLDGHRPPTPVERAQALLANVPLGLHVHLMPRGPGGEIPTPQVAVAEEEADLLARELLAPTEVVWHEAGSRVDIQAAVRLLLSRFGLPEEQARLHAEVLYPRQPVDPLLSRLGRR